MDKISTDGWPNMAGRPEAFARACGTAFDIHAEDKGGSVIELYDEIGFWGVTAKDFAAMLKDASGDLVLKINSPGGNVFDGITIYNQLVDYPGKVNVQVQGLAASAASLIAMAGDEIAMAENSFMMIHRAWGLVIGNANDLRDMANVVEKFDGALAKTYASRTGLGIRAIMKLMDEETWMSADEAKESGFATTVTKRTEAKAQFDLSVFAKAPSGLSQEPGDWIDPKTTRDVERMLTRDAGLTRSRAQAVIAACKAENENVMRDADIELAELIRGSADRIATILGRKEMS